MGYDMYAKENGKYFRANIWGMGLLREVMIQAGVDTETQKNRMWQTRDEDGEEVEQDSGEEMGILGCFGSNDGWLVDPEDCVEIHEKLSKFSGRHYTKNGSMCVASTGLADALSSISPEIAEQFKEKREHLSEDDLDYIQEFADYCKNAAKLGGFYVW